MLALGEMIRSARERVGWTQDGLAERVGVSRVQISRIESGSSSTDAERLLRLANALSLDPGLVLQAAAETEHARRQSASPDEEPV